MDKKTINGEDFYQVAGGMVLQMKPVNKKGAQRVWIAQIA